MDGVLRNCKCSLQAEFCYDCLEIKFGNRRHTCKEADDVPDEGEDKTRNPQFIEPTTENPPTKARIINLDFET